MRAWMVLLALALLGCRAGAEPGATMPDVVAGPPAPRVVLQVVPDRASAGANVELVLRNGSSETIGYNLCTSQLARETAGEWEPVPSDRDCTMELRLLMPDSSASYTMELPASLAAGSYRFETPVERMESGAREPAASDPFAVE